MIEPRIYVGTYAKYNNGSLYGDWVDLSDFQSRDDFYEHCRELHSDETEPEFMFQDHEYIPTRWVSECSIDEKVWDWLELPEDDRKAVAAYYNHISDSDTVDYILDRLIGSADVRFDTVHNAKKDWIYNYLEETGFFAGWSESALNYFDVDSYLHDCELDGMTFVVYEGTLYVFSSN
jgi:antirestriction protein